MCDIRGIRHDDICLCLGPADRSELKALISNRNTPRKLVWRAKIVLATADGNVEADGVALEGAVSR